MLRASLVGVLLASLVGVLLAWLVRVGVLRASLVRVGHWHGATGSVLRASLVSVLPVTAVGPVWGTVGFASRCAVGFASLSRFSAGSA